MNIEQAIGEELRACRHKKQISQEQLGFDAWTGRMPLFALNRLQIKQAHVCHALRFTWRSSFGTIVCMETVPEPTHTTEATRRAWQSASIGEFFRTLLDINIFGGS